MTIRYLFDDYSMTFENEAECFLTTLCVMMKSVEGIPHIRWDSHHGFRVGPPFGKLKEPGLGQPGLGNFWAVGVRVAKPGLC